LTSQAEQFNQRNIDEFRASHGRVGGNFDGAPLSLLHTVGARSGQRRINPVIKGVDVKQDRVVVVTGAAGGIGSVLVDRFLANGDTVLATDATKEHLEQLVSSRNAGQRLVTFPADIASEDDCLELAHTAVLYVPDHVYGEVYRRMPKAG
jgi:NADPH:quinone reductase-like Zn-dependent oxidoreductase